MSHKLVLRTFMVMSLLAVLVAAPTCASPQTTVYVAPSTMTVTVGQIFSVNVETSDVVDLYGWEFTLKWNPTFLDVLNVTEGEFLKSGGDTFFWPIMNKTDGYILADCTLIGNISGVNGSGTLAIVEFKVESAGESILDLYDTKLVNSLEQPMAHTSNDGYVTTSKPVGMHAWPMFRYDLSHSGYSPSTAPNTNNTIWNYTTGDFVFSSPAVADGRVYVGSLDNKTYCLNASTGEHIWNYTTGGQVWSSPAVADGRVYVGSYDGKVWCLNASTRQHIWNYTTGVDVYSSPAVADGKVYIGAFHNVTFCLNASTGEYIWNYTTGGQVWSSPAVADGRVYVGSWSDDKVWCFNASTGEYPESHVWNYTTGDAVFSSPAVADGRVYVGSLDNKTYCLNASTGEHIWNYTTGGQVWSSPAVADGRVYVGSYDGKVWCLNASATSMTSDEREIWNYTTSDAVFSSPAVADGRVYVGSLDNKTYCLNASTGEHIWNYTTGGQVWSSPAVADGRVYVGSYDGKVYAFAPVDVAVTDVVPWTPYCSVPVSQGYHDWNVNISVTVENNGTTPATFTVSAYANNTLIGTLPVNSLPAGQSTTITFNVPLASAPYGYYPIKGNATLVGDTNPGNDEYTNGQVLVKVFGDVDANGKVDATDAFSHVALAYGSSFGQPKYDCQCDFDCDGDVDPTDVFSYVAIWYDPTTIYPYP